ncbi:MAG TPA: SpoIID/LytB domain-containing protein [Gaiellaceae bacterium]|nr:SpoIID/LytB domain-containing protein [Gaiellaceae bacterium]
MVRRLVPLLAVVSALAVPSGAGAAAMLLVDGRGWGHGIGMSQWGAQGFALQGSGYRAILAHYYPGTTLAPAPASRVRALVAEKPNVAISSAGALAVRDAAGATLQLEPGTYRLGPALRLQRAGGDVQLTAPVTVASSGAPLAVEGKPYRGTLTLHVRDRTVLAVNELPLEQYLYGVVPHEMPAGWHAEALKAQAVAARTYALVSRRASGPFDVYADVRSQVYSGISAEDPRTTAAIDATAGEVLRYGQALAHTFFFSTSGGKTAAIEDVWSGSTPQPYLVSRPDPHDRLSPHHAWGPVVFTGAQVRKALGVLPDDLVLTRNASDRVGAVRVVGKAGERTLTGADVRTRLGLRSTWFSVRLLTLDAPPRASAGQVVVLRGRLRGLPVAGLQRRVGTGAWERVGTVRANAAGAYAVRVRVAATTTYRLAAAGHAGANVRVLVEQRAGTGVRRVLGHAAL